MMTYRRFIAAIALLLTGGAAAGPPPDATGRLTVVNPYIRATAPGQTNTAMFFTLENLADRCRTLVAVSSLLADRVELHVHRMQNNLAVMRPVRRIAIPAGESVTLRPGGLHVMLLGIRQPLKPGGQAAVTLLFEDGARIQVTVPIRRIRRADIAPHDHHRPGLPAPG